MANGIHFQADAPVTASAPNRTDIACFVGYVARRQREGAYSAIPQPVLEALRDRGWSAGPYARAANIEPLLDVPVPIESWSAFEQLFDGDARLMSAEDGAIARPRLSTYLAAAVRSFFAQGGRKCYVIRCGDPWPYLSSREHRLSQLQAAAGRVALIPGYREDKAAAVLQGSPADPQNWHGVTHVYGLDDVSFLSLPDLPDALRVDVDPLPPAYVPPAPPEQFVECSAPLPPVAGDATVQQLPAPVLDANAYTQWARAVGLLRSLLRLTRAGMHRRDVQLLAALPLPARAHEQDHGVPGADPLRFLDQRGWLLAAGDGQLDALGSAFLQLTYPWVSTERNPRLPGALENPEGPLAGVLARNALLQGSFRSAAGSALIGVRKVFPELSREQTQRMQQPSLGDAVSLSDKLSLLGPTPRGFALLTDVTMSASRSWRAAGVNRLMGVILRAARAVGHDLVFEPSGERLWARARERMSELMLMLWRGGALSGTKPADAYALRCDRTTMTQDDIDNGSLILSLEFTAAQPLERIVVSLSLSEGGIADLQEAA